MSIQLLALQATNVVLNRGRLDSSSGLLIRIRLYEATLDRLRSMRHGPYPEEEEIQARIAVLRDQLMHPLHLV